MKGCQRHGNTQEIGQEQSIQLSPRKPRICSMQGDGEGVAGMADIFNMKTNLLSEKQYSFLSGRSTSLQLIKVIEEWTSIVDAGILVYSRRDLHVRQLYEGI